MSITNGQSMEDIRDTVLSSFVDMFDQFQTQLSRVFPRCPAIVKYRFKFDTAFSEVLPAESRKQNAQTLLKLWHDSLSPYYSACTKKDENVFDANIEVFHEIRIKEKWTSDLHPQTKEFMWQYVQKLNEFANIYHMYNDVPSGMMNTIHSTAFNLAEDIQSGKVSMDTLDIGELAQRVMSQINESDLQDFATSLTNEGGGMQRMSSMYEMVGSMICAQGGDTGMQMLSGIMGGNMMATPETKK